ncbi:elongation factor P 5-aminopentanone reductase [Bacillus sp. FJAT-45350]|uniref:elongation factor P 5-aminopentanone reductase n=1 Tax=Bacillus sp. FJAT-45350 TaxID=2011014 RepID=UPI000BB9595C|nr:SDR family oxidoreductase [Bacillus sp. FJAT-45350]
MSKWALVTGASGDIGAAIAMQLAAQGFSLYLHYHKNEQSVLELQERCNEHNIGTYLVQSDLSTPTGPNELLKQITNPVEVIIHNSGNSYFGLLTDMKDEEIMSMIQLHLTSPIQLTKALLPSMITNHSGKVIVISSIWGLTGASCEVVYSTVKGGLNSFVKALSKEVAPSNLYINGIAPGAIDTKMLSSYTEEDLRELADEIPMGRFGSPDEVANVVSFLTSEKSTYINGQIISVNGAWYC